MASGGGGGRGGLGGVSGGGVGLGYQGAPHGHGKGNGGAGGSRSTSYMVYPPPPGTVPAQAALNGYGASVVPSRSSPFVCPSPAPTTVSIRPSPASPAPAWSPAAQQTVHQSPALAASPLRVEKQYTSETVLALPGAASAVDEAVTQAGCCRGDCTRIATYHVVSDEMVHLPTIDNWSCLNMSNMSSEQAEILCTNLIHTYNATVMTISPTPIIEVKSTSPIHLVNALKDVHRRATQMLSRQGIDNLLQLLFVILPEDCGIHDFLKRVCKTTVGNIFQYCSAKHVSRQNMDCMGNIATVTGNNSGPEQAFTYSGRPYLPEVPVIFFASPIAHSPSGEYSTSSNIATLPRCSKNYARISHVAHTPTVDELASITTVFVRVYGYHISMPVNLDTTTVGQLVRDALVKRNIKIEDAHYEFSGSMLDAHSLLSAVNIERDSNIFVTPRRRGGVETYYSLCFEQLSEILLNNANRKFERVWLRKNHVLPGQDQLVSLLSPFSQYIIHKILVCVLRDGHQQRICWGGNFRLHHFLMSNGHVIIDPNLATFPYTPDKGGADCDQLYFILSTFHDSHKKLPCPSK